MSMKNDGSLLDTLTVYVRRETSVTWHVTFCDFETAHPETYLCGDEVEDGIHTVAIGGSTGMIICGACVQQWYHQREAVDHIMAYAKEGV